MISTMLNVIITNVINQQFYVKRKYYKRTNQQVVVIWYLLVWTDERTLEFI